MAPFWWWGPLIDDPLGIDGVYDALKKALSDLSVVKGAVLGLIGLGLVARSALPLGLVGLQGCLSLGGWCWLAHRWSSGGGSSEGMARTTPSILVVVPDEGCRRVTRQIFLGPPEGHLAMPTFAAAFFNLRLKDPCMQKFKVR